MRRLYRTLLRCAPADVRDTYGDDMSDTFDALYDQAASEGRIATARLLVREATSLLAAHVHHRGAQLMPILHATFSRPRFGQTLRSLRRRPTFAAASLLTLALGTASTTVIWAVVDTVVLKPLPYPDAGQLVTLQEAMPAKGNGVSLIAPVRLADWRRLNTTFADVAGTYVESVTDTSGDAPERFESRSVTPGYFAVMGAAPILGRTFSDDEERFGGPRAVVISDALWSRRYQRSASVLSQHLTLAGQPVPIVGVMSKTFASAAVDMWLPAQFAPGLMQARAARFLSGIGRMKPGVSIDQARADLIGVQQRLGIEYPQTDKDWTVRLAALQQARVGSSGRTLWMVFGAIALLWLIGVANLAGLMLVQLHRRSREFAIRTAIGASRRHVMSVVVHEVIVLAGAGGAIGLLLAAWALPAIPSVFASLPRLNELQLDWRAVVAACVSTAAAALAIGVWPVVIATRARVAGRLSSGSWGSTSRHHALQRVLVLGQVALSLWLVGSAALLVKSYYRLVTVNAGFVAEDVWTFNVGAGWDEDRQRVGQFQEHLLEDLRRVPGVTQAGFTNFLPMSRSTLRAQVRVSGVAGPERDGTMSAGTRLISADYLRTLQIPVNAGTDCPALRTDFNAPRSVLVNQRFVDTYGGGQSLLGRTLTIPQDAGASYTIAGVLGDVSEDDTRGQPSPYIYACESAGAWPDPEYVVRTTNTAGLPAALRAIVREHAPGRAVFGIRRLDDVNAELRATPRLNAAMLALFATAALLLASVGLYSLFMLLVRERVREIGVRLALGATPAQVISIVLSGAGKLVMGGLTIGAVLLVLASRYLQAELIGVSPADPLALAGATLLLAVVAGLAVALPAARAGRVDPVIAMRAD